MVDFKNETAISISQAARLLPPGRRGRPVHLSCILRWIIDGVRTPAGVIVRLEGGRAGSRWITTVESIERFVQRQTPSFEPEPMGVRTQAQRSKASERAAKE